MKKKSQKASKKKPKGGKKMLGLGKKKDEKPEVKPEDTGSLNDSPNKVSPEEPKETIPETGKVAEPEKPKEAEEMTLATKKEPESKKEPLKIDGKVVRSVYEFKTYIVYDFVGGGRKKVMKKDVKKEEEK